MKWIYQLLPQFIKSPTKIRNITIILIGIYLIFPGDLLPDFILGFGWVDDLLVGSIGYLIFNHLKTIAKRYAEDMAYHQKTYQRARSNAGQDTQTKGKSESAARSPYEVLEVSPKASAKELRRAYLRMLSIYHPDKVAYLGGDFQDLAKIKTQEIIAAYEQVKNQHT